MFKFWKKLWNLIDLSQKRIKVLFVFLIIAEIVHLIGPYLLKLIIDTLTNFSVDKIDWLLVLIAGMFCAEQFRSFFAYFKDRRIFSMLIDIEYYLPIRAQKKLVTLSLGYHERENTGNKITKIQHGVDKIIDLLANMSWDIMPTLLQLVITFVILMVIDWRFGISMFVFAPIFIWLTYKVNQDLSPMRKKRHESYEEASGKMGQSIININTVKSFSQEAREIKEYGLIRRTIKINEVKEWFRMLRLNLGRNLIIDLGRVSILLLGVYLVWNGQVTIGTFVFVVTLSEKTYFSLFRLSRLYDRIQESAEAVDRFMDLTQEEPDIKNPKRGLRPRSVEGEVEFQNVTFAYDESHNKALEEINLAIKAGTINAFVGPSGGGKTTIARMIYRHYDPQTGAVLLDGHDLRKYDIAHFRQAIAIVPQEVEIFNASVRDNISYSNPKASFGEIKRAARIANAEEFIKKLKDGYDTDVGERGIRLSGGQRQRVGIARAILANPKILIFDEATSSLDSRSEKLIQQAMDRVSQSRTVILIAHRLSTIRHADTIFVLENGRVVESGSHGELSNTRGGLYAKLMKLQTSGDVD